MDNEFKKIKNAITYNDIDTVKLFIEKGYDFTQKNHKLLNYLSVAFYGYEPQNVNPYLHLDLLQLFLKKFQLPETILENFCINTICEHNQIVFDQIMKEAQFQKLSDNSKEYLINYAIQNDFLHGVHYFCQFKPLLHNPNIENDPLHIALSNHSEKSSLYLLEEYKKQGCLFPNLYSEYFDQYIYMYMKNNSVINALVDSGFSSSCSPKMIIEKAVYTNNLVLLTQLLKQYSLSNEDIQSIALDTIRKNSFDCFSYLNNTYELKLNPKNNIVFLALEEDSEYFNQQFFPLIMKNLEQNYSSDEIESFLKDLPKGVLNKVFQYEKMEQLIDIKSTSNTKRTKTNKV